MKLDETARYSSSHEWVRREDDEFVIGISDHAQHSLGDIVYLDLPELGRFLDQGAVFGVVESVKAASDLYCPLAGTVSLINPELASQPELVNQDCYGAGWLIRLKPANPADWEKLLSPEAYSASLGEA